MAAGCLGPVDLPGRLFSCDLTGFRDQGLGSKLLKGGYIGVR